MPKVFRVLLFADDTIDLNLDGLIAGLNTITSRGIRFAKGRSRFQIDGSVIRYSQSYEQLSKQMLTEVRSADLSLCFTKVPYDNNYFFEGEDDLVIVSFYGWEQLTTLPIENGATYFLAKLLRFRLPLPDPHAFITGCINDFLWDKTGVDLGMKSGLLCDGCQQYMSQIGLPDQDKRVLDTVQRILDDLSSASRNEENLVEYWMARRDVRGKSPDAKFAVFLCHNSKDKPDVRLIRKKLENSGIKTWFDEEQLRPGTAWQVVLEEQISSIESAAVFVGRSGIGPWQDMEMRAFLSEFINRRLPVIPVILASATAVPELPIFLRQLTWVDFRRNQSNAMARLIWGITGKKPNRSARLTNHRFKHAPAKQT